MFDALIKRHKVALTRKEYQTGILASTIANFSMSAPKTPLLPSDFVTLDKPTIKEPTKAEIAERLHAKILAIFGAPKPKT